MGQPESPRRPEAEHATLALIRLAAQYPEELTLLTLGPLTNVALAIHLEPHFLKNLKRLVVMGGAIDGRGNTTPPTEFNIGVDPEAAKIVFEACAQSGVKAEIISWEATLAHPTSPEKWDSIITGESAVARFLQGITRYLKERMKITQRKNFLWPDPLAAAVTLAPEIVLDQEARFVEVEAGHNLARGQTLVDYRSYGSRPPNTRLIRAVDLEKFHGLLQLAAQLPKGGA
jgi:purine nucleosidase